MARLFLLALSMATSAALSTSAKADETRDWTLTVETGPVWLSRNDVQIPNDNAGDRFDLL
jgi:hypothetical protein